MFTSTLVVLAAAALAIANPVARQAPLCSGLYSTQQCCATDVLGLADLDCANPPDVPTSPDEFQSICADIGQRARCCAIPILGQDLLCETPAGLPA